MKHEIHTLNTFRDIYPLSWKQQNVSFNSDIEFPPDYCAHRSSTSLNRTPYNLLSKGMGKH
jgi:hypothetical protein